MYLIEKYINIDVEGLCLYPVLAHSQIYLPSLSPCVNGHVNT